MSTASEYCGQPLYLNMGGTANVGQLNYTEPYPIPKFINLGSVGQYQCLYNTGPSPDPPFFTLGPCFAWERSSPAYIPNLVTLDRYITAAGNMSDILGSQGAELDDTLTSGEAVYNANHPGDTWEDFITRAQSNVSWIWGSLRDGGCGIVKVSTTQVKFIGTYGVYDNDNDTDERIAATQTNTPFNIADIQQCVFLVFYNKQSGVFNSAVSITYPIGSEVHCYRNPTTYITSFGNIIYGEEYAALSDVLDNSVVEFGDGVVPNTCINTGTIASPYGGGPYDVYWPETVISIAGYSLKEGSSDTGLGDEYGRGGDPDGNGQGDFNNDSDTVDPTSEDQFTIDAQSCGFITVFKPTKSTLQDFAAWLYGTLPSTMGSFLDQISKLQKNPMDAIISLNLAHYDASSGGAEGINFFGQTSGYSAPVVSGLTQIKKCGTIHIHEFSGNFLDYDKSSIKAFLPYCGLHEMDVRLCMGADLELQYILDMLTGACVAEITVKRCRSTVTSDPVLDATVYRFTGNFFQQVPISNVDYTGIIQGQLGLAASAASFATGNFIGGAQGALSSAMAMRPTVEHVGNAGSSYGYMSTQQPFIIQEYSWYNWPTEVNPRTPSFNNYYGRPTYDYTWLDNLDGYTEIDSGCLWTDKFDWITSEEESILKTILDGGGIYIDHSSEYYNYDPEE